MIQDLSMTQLRHSPGKYIDQVHDGITFVLTRSGKQVAILTAIPEPGKPTDADVPIQINSDGSHQIKVDPPSEPQIIWHCRAHGSPLPCPRCP